MGAIQFQRKIRKLASIMPWKTAIDLALYRGPEKLVSARLRATSRPIWFRTSTSDLACVEKAFIEQQFEPPFLLNPKIIVDGGANIGAAAVFFAAKYQTTRIFAIEPEATNFEILAKNSRGTNIVPIRAALWPDNSDLIFSDPGAEKWAFSVAPAAAEPSQIRGLRMEELITRHGIDYIDILKLDIEGAERELFSSANIEWLERVGLIIIELHDRFRPGCSQAFYRAIAGRDFSQELRGENIFVRFDEPCRN